MLVLLAIIKTSDFLNIRRVINMLKLQRVKIIKSRVNWYNFCLCMLPSTIILLEGKDDKHLIWNNVCARARVCVFVIIESKFYHFFRNNQKTIWFVDFVYLKQSRLFIWNRRLLQKCSLHFLPRETLCNLNM